MKLTFLRNLAIDLDIVSEEGDILESESINFLQSYQVDVELLDETEDELAVKFANGRVSIVPKEAVAYELNIPEVADLVIQDADEAALALTQHQQPEQ